MPDRCSMEGCAEAAITSLEDHPSCYQHFLTCSYQRLEAISAQIREPLFQERQAETIGRFLEDCMRNAADVATAVTSPSNLERARVLDILLWASELHGLLRRGPRVPARIPLLLRSQTPGRLWEEEAETQLLSQHGAQVACQHDATTGDTLLCIRRDNGRQADSRVVWTRRRGTGQLEIGIEFLSEANFWGLGSGNSGTSSVSPVLGRS